VAANYRRGDAAGISVPEMRYIELLGPAVLRGMRVTTDHVMPALRCLDAFSVRVLYQLRRTVRTGAGAAAFSAARTADKTAQADIRLGQIRNCPVRARRVMHHRRARVDYAQAGGRAVYVAADKGHCRRRAGVTYRPAPDVQRIIPAGRSCSARRNFQAALPAYVIIPM
jgi:hypothetical protein